MSTTAESTPQANPQAIPVDQIGRQLVNNFQPASFEMPVLLDALAEIDLSYFDQKAFLLELEIGAGQSIHSLLFGKAVTLVPGDEVGEVEGDDANSGEVVEVSHSIGAELIEGYKPDSLGIVEVLSALQEKFGGKPTPAKEAQIVALPPLERAALFELAVRAGVTVETSLFGHEISIEPHDGDPGAVREPRKPLTPLDTMSEPVPQEQS